MYVCMKSLYILLLNKFSQFLEIDLPGTPDSNMVTEITEQYTS